jgi:hypothetical protein
MLKAVTGLAIPLGGIAESRAYWQFRHRNQRTERVCDG